MQVLGVYTEKVEKQDWKGFRYTGEILRIKYPDGILGSVVNHYRVVTGRFTPSGGVRDCGNHYIKANYSSYDRIDKGTFKIVRDVADE